MNEPRISVVVPNYNHAQYLPRCLNALINQPVLPFEIIVVDDASTDNSVEVIEEFARRHPLVRLARNEQNLHVVRTMARGLSLASGEYVLFSAADDEVRSGIFDHLSHLIRAYPNAGVYSGVGEFCDTVTTMKWYYGGGMPSRPCYLSPQEVVDIAKTGKLSICSYNAVFNKTALLDAGGWIPDLRWSSDWFATHVVGLRHGMCHAPEILSTAYIYPNSYSQLPGRLAAECKVVDRLLDLLDSAPYADVAPLIRRSGLLGSFGIAIVKVMIRRRGSWSILTLVFVKHLARRLSETYGRRFLPEWVARTCARWLYGPGASNRGATR